MKKHIAICISLISLLLISIIGCSSNKNISENFKWGASKEEIQEQCQKQVLFGEDSTVNSICYKQTNIEFFENNEVIAMYYFNGSGNGLSKVIYDVSKCDENNVDNYVEYLRKTCKEIEYGESKIGNASRLIGKWEINNTSITYEKLYNFSWVKFYFEPID